MGLNRGQAIVSIGSDIYSVATPMLNFPKYLKPTKLVQHAGKKAIGKPMNLVKRYKDYLMSDADGKDKPESAKRQTY
jgi:hypothetical protein